MNANKPGLTFKETMAGGFSLGAADPKAGQAQGRANGTELAMHAEVLIEDMARFIEDPNHLGKLKGGIDFAPMGMGMVAETGVFNLFSPAVDCKTMIYELGFQHQGQPYYLAGKKVVRDDPGFDLWSDTTTLLTTLHEGPNRDGKVVGAGVLSLGVTDLVKLLATVRVTNTDAITVKSKTIAQFGKFFLGELWDSYARFVKS